jgi:hypothetical protein
MGLFLLAALGPNCSDALDCLISGGFLYIGCGTTIAERLCQTQNIDATIYNTVFKLFLLGNVSILTPGADNL